MALPAAVVIVVTGALYFADREMKTADNYFRGFPALWNPAAFYLFLLRPAAMVRAAIVALFAVLTFVPIRSFIRCGCAFAHTEYCAADAVGRPRARCRSCDLDPGPWVAAALVPDCRLFLRRRPAAARGPDMPMLGC